jgi:hypothetical protein
MEGNPHVFGISMTVNNGKIVSRGWASNVNGGDTEILLLGRQND